MRYSSQLEAATISHCRHTVSHTPVHIFRHLKPDYSQRVPESARVGVGGRFGRVAKGAPGGRKRRENPFSSIVLTARGVRAPPVHRTAHPTGLGPLPRFPRGWHFKPARVCRRGPIPARTAAIAACLGELCAPRRPRVALSARSHVYLCFEAVFSARRPLVVRVDPAAARVGRVGPSDKREACWRRRAGRAR